MNENETKSGPKRFIGPEIWYLNEVEFQKKNKKKT